MRKERMTSKEKLLFIIPCCLLALPWLLRQNVVGQALLHLDLRGDGMDKAMRRAASYGAIDCGRVAIRGSRTAADACSVAAFKAHRPFRVRYDLQGIDSSMSEGIVGTSQGQMLHFFYDGDPSGGGNVGERVSQSACRNPKIIGTGADQHLECP